MRSRTLKSVADLSTSTEAPSTCCSFEQSQRHCASSCSIGRQRRQIVSCKTQRSTTRQSSSRTNRPSETDRGGLRVVDVFRLEDLQIDHHGSVMCCAAVRRGIVSGKICTKNNIPLDTTQLALGINVGDCVTSKAFQCNALVFDSKSLVISAYPANNTNPQSIHSGCVALTVNCFIKVVFSNFPATTQLYWQVVDTAFETNETLNVLRTIAQLTIRI